jgi:hypothetical protein
MKIENPEPEETIKYCARVLDKNIGIANQTPEDRD